MALFIGNTLAKTGIFDTGDAEQAFHPWWKTIQDYVCYTAIIIGKFTAHNEHANRFSVDLSCFCKSRSNRICFLLISKWFSRLFNQYLFI